MTHQNRSRAWKVLESVLRAPLLSYRGLTGHNKIKSKCPRFSEFHSTESRVIKLKEFYCHNFSSLPMSTSSMMTCPVKLKEELKPVTALPAPVRPTLQIFLRKLTLKIISLSISGSSW